MRLLRFSVLIFMLSLLLPSCTIFLLDEIEGGHSPMMQLDGKWDIDEHFEIENGQRSDVKSSERVWFNAQKDIGDYCEGSWLETKFNEDEFLWGIDPEGTEFVLQDSPGQDVYYKVIEQSKKKFVIEKEENGVVTHMKFSK